MKIRDLFNYVHKIKENPFEDSELLVWLNEVEGLVHTKVFLLAPSEYKEITADDIDSDTFKLLIVGPHQKIYPAYLVAMIDFANGEYNRYANTLEMFNAHFTELQMWQRQYAGPADGECVFRGYYLSAYGIAKNRGVFNGSEEEWLASLKGEKGDSAYDIAVKLGYKGTEQEWIDYLAKAQSDAIDAARKSALEDIESYGEANRSLIDSAREIALRQIAEANEELSSNLGEYHSGLDDHYSNIAAELNSFRGDSIDEIASAKTAAIDEIESTGSIFANALKGTASGEAIAITDASPIEHEMGVKVRGKNLINMSAVTIPSGQSYSYENGIATISQGTYVYVPRARWDFFDVSMFEGKTVTVSLDVTEDQGTNTKGNILYIQGISDKEYNLKPHGFTQTGKITLTYTFADKLDYDQIRIMLYAQHLKDASESFSFTNVQFEIGTTATTYAPYVEDISTVKVTVGDGGTVSKQYDVNADGSVDGVTSIYPSMTLSTDTVGAAIDCTYNRDINKAFEELYNAIISTGGNI